MAHKREPKGKDGEADFEHTCFCVRVALEDGSRLAVKAYTSFVDQSQDQLRHFGYKEGQKFYFYVFGTARAGNKNRDRMFYHSVVLDSTLNSFGKPQNGQICKELGQGGHGASIES